MKKVALALLVLAFTVPAMGDVNITMTAGAGADVNKVTIGYNCTGIPAEEVRAFALTVAVSDGAFLVGSAAPVGDPNRADYWVYPGSITFTVDEGNTVVDSFGTPVAEQTVDGGVVEMASLYAASDPCHPVKPASSGSLCSFRVKNLPGTCGPDKKVTVSLSLNSKRGNVVLKDPNLTPTVNLPAPLDIICPDAGPACWACVRQPFGDATGDGITDLSDLLALKRSWLKSTSDPHGTGLGQYNCCADFTQDGLVDLSDLLRLKQNWLSSGATCADISCP